VSSCEKDEQFNLSWSVPSLERTVPLFNYHRFIAFFYNGKFKSGRRARRAVSKHGDSFNLNSVSVAL
jgi:hypothetical protein